MNWLSTRMALVLSLMTVGSCRTSYLAEGDVAAATTAPRIVPLCTGVTVDINGTQAASQALQTCINATPDGGTLQIPWGIYAIDAQITLTKPIVLTTAGSMGQLPCFDTTHAATLGTRYQAVPCSMFVAQPGLWTNGGMLTMSSHNVVVDHILLNGNRAARITPERTKACQGGGSLPRGGGSNGSASDCKDCAFTNGGSTLAVCGSGFAWGGGSNDYNAHIAYNVFTKNGDRALVSDGLTLGIPRNGNIEHNYFEDNSDVNLILFGGPGVAVHDNFVYNRGSQASFAGLMLDNMGEGSGDLGNFVGANIYGNWINCSFGTPASYRGCDFGVMVGPYAWYTTNSAGQALPRIYGGTVFKNNVYGAKQGLLMSGAGTTANPTNVDNTNVVQNFAPGNGTGFSNSLRGVPAGYGCGANGRHATSAFNADPGSVWNLAAAQPAWTFNKWQACY